MAIAQVLFTYCDKIGVIVDRFSKVNEPIVYDEETSVEGLKDLRKKAIEVIKKRNTTALQCDADSIEMNKVLDELSKYESRFLTHTGLRFTKDSDEYVWAGGTRQSESIKKARQTREETARKKAEQKKAAEENKKKDKE